MRSIQAHRIIWPQPGQVAVESFECPPPGENEVIVEALMSLISPGTERAFFLAQPNTRLDFPAPAVGYSHIGRVAVCGAAVSGFEIGDVVASNARHVSHARLSTERLVKVPAGLPQDQAAFFNLLSIALQGVRKARIELGHAVAVIGQGLVGLFALQLARRSGAYPLIAVDPVARRRALARSCGADHVIDPEEADWHAQIGRLTDDRGLDVAIECTGQPGPIVEAFPLVAARGRLVLLGSPRGSSADVNFYPHVHARGLTIVGAHADIRPQRDRAPHFWTWRQDCALVLQLLSAGRLQVAPMISEVFPWHRAAAAYAQLQAPAAGQLGLLLDWTAP
jgi:2-desacetyl-2-hydroxyethyl bacteriochlorophyllide A dehydrogenase